MKTNLRNEVISYRINLILCKFCLFIPLSGIYQFSVSSNHPLTSLSFIGMSKTKNKNLFKQFKEEIRKKNISWQTKRILKVCDDCQEFVYVFVSLQFSSLSELSYFTFYFFMICKEIVGRLNYFYLCYFFMICKEILKDWTDKRQE